MEIAVGAGSAVSIAYDERLAAPVWLTAQFQRTGTAVLIDRKPMRIYEHRVNREESLTLGANSESAKSSECNMYAVFVNQASAGR